MARIRSLCLESRARVTGKHVLLVNSVDPLNAPLQVNPIQDVFRDYVQIILLRNPAIGVKRLNAYKVRMVLVVSAPVVRLTTLQPCGHVIQRLAVVGLKTTTQTNEAGMADGSTCILNITQV